MRHLRLIGAGHAHLAVLLHLKKQRPKNTKISLICADRYQRYSGMLPAWMAGHATEAEMSIDIAALCAVADVEWIAENMLGLQASERYVATSSHTQLAYDLLSINTGAETNLSWLSAVGERLLSIRPLSVFVRQWPRLLEQAKQQPSYHLVVVGAGAAAVELAMAAQVVLQKISPQHRVSLVCGRQLLPDFSAAQLSKISKHLNQLGISVVFARAAGFGQGLLLSNGQQLHADRVIAATGATAPSWTALTQLDCDAAGFIQVGATHQSTSHPDVFAVGDICQRVDRPLARSGVHAVHAGAVLAENLLAYLDQKPLQMYQPKARSLYLLSCGSRDAVACWGGYAVEGAWVWRLKQRIDHGFVKRYQMTSPTSIDDFGQMRD